MHAVRTAEEVQRREIFRGLVQLQDHRLVADRKQLKPEAIVAGSYQSIAHRYQLDVDAVRLIAREGLKAGWLDEDPALALACGTS